MSSVRLRAKGCGGAVIYAAGFAETGARRSASRACSPPPNGMPLMGPNCYGFVNTLSRAALWPDESGLEPVARGVALITQSGNIACNFTMMMRGLPVAAVFSIGNQVDVGMHDDGGSPVCRSAHLGHRPPCRGPARCRRPSPAPHALRASRKVPIVVLRPAAPNRVPRSH